MGYVGGVYRAPACSSATSQLQPGGSRPPITVPSGREAARDSRSDRERAGRARQSSHRSHSGCAGVVQDTSKLSDFPSSIPFSFFSREFIPGALIFWCAPRATPATGLQVRTPRTVKTLHSGRHFGEGHAPLFKGFAIASLCCAGFVAYDATQDDKKQDMGGCPGRRTSTSGSRRAPASGRPSAR